MAWQEFQAFDSSNLASVRYDEETQVLEVTFKNGGVYQYYDVPPQISSAFENAPSKGVFLSASIKGTYRFSKV